MRQFIVLCLLAICIPSESFGEGIFGLKKGMTLEEIGKLKFGYIKQDKDNPVIFLVEQPQKPQGADSVYFIIIPEIGLLKVRFVWIIETNFYGDGLKRKFNELESILSKKYGKGKKVDYLKSDSIWDDPKYYMRSLEKNERVLEWYSTDILDSNKWELSSIIISTEAFSDPQLYSLGLVKGFVMLSYEFQGWGDYLNRQNSQF